jgi:hypothetical protein
MNLSSLVLIGYYGGMVIDMNEAKLQTLAPVQAFLDGTHISSQVRTLRDIEQVL